jgi:hypothetical protein
LPDDADDSETLWPYFNDGPLVTRPVTVQFLKNPDIIHWGFDAIWLGEDEWGDWIAAPTGTRRWKGERQMPDSAEPGVLCAPRGEWWHLHYTGESARTYVLFVDIVTPPVWVSPNRYEMIDLDLDVGVGLDGEIVIEDEDEFELHQVRYGYTEEMIRGAVEETARVVGALEGRKEPFFEVAESWLRRVDG